MLVDTADLVRIADIATEHGVTPAAASNWHQRHRDFPAAVYGSGKSRLWLRPEVDAWAEHHHRGRFAPEPPELVLLAHG